MTHPELKKKQKWSYRGTYMQPMLSASFWPLWHKARAAADILPQNAISKTAILNGDFYWHTSDVYFELMKQVEGLLKKEDYASIASFFTKVAEINNQWEQTYVAAPDTVTLENTEKYFGEYLNMICVWSAIFAYIIPLEHKITELLEAQGKTLALSAQYFTPEKKTDHELFFSKQKALVEKYKDELISGEYSIAFKREIEKLVHEYGWIGTHTWMGEGYSFKKCIEELKGIASRGSEQVSSETVSGELNAVINPELRTLYSQCIYWRTHLAESVDKGLFAWRSYFAGLAASFGMHYERLVEYTWQEVIELQKAGKINETIDLTDRRKAYGLYYDGETTHVLVGDEALKAQAVLKADVDGTVKEIKGQIAFKGKVQGKVKIVTSPQDGADLTLEHILVAYETTPDLVPLMSKVAGIVTDVGGLTSHAAIVSRELKKPTLVGTKTASKVLKDGDIVVVDAEKGVVIKIDK